jgi:hypothetical protein
MRKCLCSFWSILLFSSHFVFVLFCFLNQSIRAENDPEDSCSSRDALIKVDTAVTSRRRAVSETAAHTPGYVCRLCPS